MTIGALGIQDRNGPAQPRRAKRLFPPHPLYKTDLEELYRTLQQNWSYHPTP